MEMWPQSHTKCFERCGLYLKDGGGSSCLRRRRQFSLKLAVVTKLFIQIPHLNLILWSFCCLCWANRLACGNHGSTWSLTLEAIPAELWSNGMLYCASIMKMNPLVTSRFLVPAQQHDVTDSFYSIPKRDGLVQGRTGTKKEPWTQPA